MGKVLFIGASWVIAKYLAVACIKLGYEPIFFGNLDFYAASVQAELKKMPCYEVDINAVEDMYALVQKENITDIVAVTSSADSKLKNAILLAAKLGVQGPDPAILTLTDKHSVEALLPEYSLPSVTFSKHAIPLQDINRFLEAHKTLILKPAHGSGALGIRKVNKSQDIADLTAYLNNYTSEIWLAQPFISGELYSIEGFVCKGITTILGYSLRDRIGTTEVANHFPVDAFLLPDLKTRSLQALETLIKRSNYQYGYFHAEFLSDGQAVYLIDANFGRIGGGGILEQVAASYAERPEEVATHVLSVSTLNKIPHNSKKLYQKPPQPSLNISFGLTESAQFLGIAMPQKFKSYYTAIAKENQTIEELGKNDYCWIGILAGLQEAVLQDIDVIQIKTDKGLKKPAYDLRSSYKIKTE